MAKQNKFTVTTARGMQSLLADELKQIGIKNFKQEQGSIRFTGALEEAYRVCLWSRVAIRVLLPIATIKAETPEELYAGVSGLVWENHIDENATIAVDFNSFRSKIKHNQYGAQRVKDGIVDRFRAATGQRPSVELYQPDVRINVYLKHNQAIISIDLSGDSLHKRGYRVSNTEAPLKEHLAAAILLQAEWQRLAKQGWSLIDPMCGSGTFLIEAAMIAADIAPGINRDYFGFSYWKQHDKELWKRLKAEAERRREVGMAKLPVIMGGDKNPQAVEAAIENIEAAGLAGKIEVLEQRLIDWASDTKRVAQAGLLVCNPPYGQRLGQDDDLPRLYEQLGNLMTDAYPGWRSAVITDNAQLGKFTGLTIFESAPFDNGPIPCEVLYYRAIKPIKTVTPVTHSASDDGDHDVWGQEKVAISEQGTMFANRLKKNVSHLAKWARKNEVTCYRVYDADLPDYAVAIDLYGDQVHVQEYAPPKHIDPEKAVMRLKEAMQIIPEVLELSPDAVVLKIRQRQRGKEQYEVQAAQQQRFEVSENGLRFWVNLKDYLDTGLFLDHRDVRNHLMKQTQGKAFLNLFAYTGTATVYAAAGGAKSTTTVDMSNTYLSWAKENMALNGFGGEQHQFVRADCLKWLADAQDEPARYDLIFLDPPTFSNSSKMDVSFDIQRDQISLIEQACALLTENGTLIFSTNARQFQLAESLQQSFVVADITKATMPKDFERSHRIHVCFSIQKQT
jgi:23S rRNA (guanine2445-N2)-methyltransferase / 23S rRNA (guanine2069-N7)-methyltransferase